MSITFEPADPTEFHARIAAAKAVHRQGAAVSLYSPEEYAGMKTFLTPDKTAGYALSGEDVVSVFKHPKSKLKRVGTAAMADAIAHGGKTSDAYDTVLPEMYSKAGMKVVARIPFDPKEAPADWREEDFKEHNEGRPDVVFMVHDPSTIGKQFKGVRVKTWDAGVKRQQNALAKIAKRNSAFQEGTEGGRQ